MTILLVGLKKAYHKKRCACISPQAHRLPNIMVIIN